MSGSLGSCKAFLKAAMKVRRKAPEKAHLKAHSKARSRASLKAHFKAHFKARLKARSEAPRKARLKAHVKAQETACFRAWFKAHGKAQPRARFIARFKACSRAHLKATEGAVSRPCPLRGNCGSGRNRTQHMDYHYSCPRIPQDPTGPNLRVGRTLRLRSTPADLSDLGMIRIRLKPRPSQTLRWPRSSCNHPVTLHLLLRFSLPSLPSLLHVPPASAILPFAS